jgi:hypothetical protein
MEKDQQFIRFKLKSFRSPNVIIGTAMFTLFGLVLIYLGIYLGFFFLLPLIGFAGISHKVEFDPLNKLYRYNIRLYGASTSGWSTLEEIDYISVRSFMMTHDYGYVNTDEREMEIVLIMKNRKWQPVFRCNTVDEARVRATELGNALGLRVYDALTKVWLEE